MYIHKIFSSAFIFYYFLLVFKISVFKEILKYVLIKKLQKVLKYSSVHSSVLK